MLVCSSSPPASSELGVGSGNLHRVRGDGGAEEARAVGGPGGQGQETLTGSGDGTVAVVAVAAGTGVKAGEDGGGERENNSALHLDGEMGVIEC